MCWRCTSSASNAAFCGESFSGSSITDRQRTWSYVNCGYPSCLRKDSNMRALCKKWKQWGKWYPHLNACALYKIQHLFQFVVNGEAVYFRACTWENINTPEVDCSKAVPPENVTAEWCETCDTDGCNGAASHYTYIAMVVVTSAVLTRSSML